MSEETVDPLTPNLRHVLSCSRVRACDDPKCPVHNPIGAPGMNRRDLTMFVAGVQEAVRRFQYASDEELGIPKDAHYPSRRISAVEYSICGEVERWLLNIPKKKRKGRLKSKRRILNTFH